MSRRKGGVIDKERPAGESSSAGFRGLNTKVMQNTTLFILVLFFCHLQNVVGQTTVNIRAVAGIGYAVDWVHITYRDANGNEQRINHEGNIPLGQEATINIPAGATNIRMTAKQLGSIGDSRIFNNYSLASNQRHCFELTGTLYSPKYTVVTCSWVPSGRVVVYDTELRQNIGLKRVKVVVKEKNGISTLGNTFTDNEGRFRLSEPVRGKVKYQVWFEDPDGMKVIYIANAHAESVTFEAMEGPLNHVFTQSDKKPWYWATVFNATQFYKEYARRDGIPFKSDAKVSVMYEDLQSYAPATGVQDAVIYKYDSDSREILKTVMHELAHVTHSQIDRNEYTSFAVARLSNQTWTAYGETWACGPEAIFTNRRYEPASSELAIYQNYHLSDFTYATGSNYLYIYPVVIDLMDNYNQRDRNHNNELPQDQVSGYTLREIANALRGAGNLDEWKANLARVNNPTNIYLDAYFNQYFPDRPSNTGANTIIRIKPVVGVGYSVDWIKVTYTDNRGDDQEINYEKDTPLGQEATITVPSGATNIHLEAKPVASFSDTRIFHNLSLTAGQNYCIQLRGLVNSPKYEIVGCNVL